MFIVLAVSFSETYKKEQVSILWIMFVVLAVVSVLVFLYAFRALGSAGEVEREILQRQHSDEEDTPP